MSPSKSPSLSPSMIPSQSPSISPSMSPSKSPSMSPSTSPSKSPSMTPSQSPSLSPSINPSKSPSLSPSQSPNPLAQSQSEDTPEVFNLLMTIIIATLILLMMLCLIYCSKKYKKNAPVIPEESNNDVVVNRVETNPTYEPNTRPLPNRVIQNEVYDSLSVDDNYRRLGQENTDSNHAYNTLNAETRIYDSPLSPNEAGEYIKIGNTYKSINKPKKDTRTYYDELVSHIKPKMTNITK